MELETRNLELEPGDEVGIFDGSVCVGAYTVPEEGFTPGAQIATSKDDGSGNGFVEGHTVTFRVWREDVETDIDADIFVFTDVISGNTVPQVFTALSGVNVEIGVQPPSSPSSFSASGNSNHVNLSWSTPSVGTTVCTQMVLHPRLYFIVYPVRVLYLLRTTSPTVIQIITSATTLSMVMSFRPTP